MAESPSHKFGQLIGNLLEKSLESHLRTLLNGYNFYLDTPGERPARGAKKKITWTDKFNNKHDLDFVIEKAGTANEFGTPQAFIEVAWRRYTKHSRNKAQEIQGAITPLKETYSAEAPFTGILLAGEFTGGSITQLKSLGFEVLYFSYNSVIDSFQKVDVDVFFDENTSTEELSEKVEAIERLSDENWNIVAEHLYEDNAEEVNHFLEALEDCMARSIASIRILPLYGTEIELSGVQEAMDYIDNFEENDAQSFVKFEIRVLYSNGDKIEANFSNKTSVTNFLEKF